MSKTGIRFFSYIFCHGIFSSDARQSTTVEFHVHRPPMSINGERQSTDDEVFVSESSKSVSVTCSSAEQATRNIAEIRPSTSRIPSVMNFAENGAGKPASGATRPISASSLVVEVLVQFYFLLSLLHG